MLPTAKNNMKRAKLLVDLKNYMRVEHPSVVNGRLVGK